MTISSQSAMTEVPLNTYNYDSVPKFPPGQEESSNHPHPEQQYTRPSAPIPDSQQRQGPKAVAILSLWRYELLSLLFSILAFVAIIIFLRVYEGKTLSQWGLPISLNAVVSILAGVFKGSIAIPITEGISQLKWIWFSNQYRSLADIEVYDLASRGPWGSFLLIVNQFARRQRSYLASLGALVLIIALAVDPFSQAMVDYRSCLRRSSSPAAIPRATNYNAFGTHQSAGEQSLDAPMQLAVYLGLLDPPANSSTSVVADCPTRNCTFPSDQGVTFSTLSMCHSCLDLTDTVANHSRIWNFSLPGGLSLTPPTLLTTSIAPVGESMWDKTTLMAFDALTLRYIDPSCMHNATCEMKPFAFSCSLTPCLKTYAANFTSAYQEKELSTTTLGYNPLIRDFSLAVNRTLYNGTWSDCNPTDQQTQTNSVEVFVDNSTVVGDSRELYKNITGTEPAILWYPPECVYVHGILATGAVEDFVSSFFDEEEVDFASIPAANTGPAWLQILWNNGSADLESVDAFVGGIATSMGGQIRKNPVDGDDGNSVLGQAWHTETCIVVHWGFLSFLAALLALELVFFVAVMVVNQLSRWNGDWKSSALPLLFHSLDGTGVANKEGRHFSSAAMMLDVAKQVKGKVEERDGSWHISGGA
ncbi:Fc.00g050110.m01.CDS01 [Cosmosporella sp. VM-42]